MKKRLRPRVPLVIAPFAPGHQNEFRGHSGKKLTKQIVKKNGGSQDQPGPARDNQPPNAQIRMQKSGNLSVIIYMPPNKCFQAI